MGSSSGTVTFSPGEISKTITIGIRDDDMEGHHQSRLTLTGADRAVITDDVGIVRITHDD